MMWTYYLRMTETCIPVPIKVWGICLHTSISSTTSMLCYSLYFYPLVWDLKSNCFEHWLWAKQNYCHEGAIVIVWKHFPLILVWWKIWFILHFDVYLPCDVRNTSIILVSLWVNHIAKLTNTSKFEISCIVYRIHLPSVSKGSATSTFNTFSHSITSHWW